MPVFAANLTMMFNEWPFLDRFDAAADAGFSAVEYLFPYDAAPEALAERLERNRLQQALFNLPPGDWAAGERGIAALPGRFDELRSGVDRALEYAAATGAKKLHLMAGIADPADPEALSRYGQSVTYTAERLAEKGIDLMLEPINARNMPGYFLNDFNNAVAIIKELELPNLKLQFDIYHRQIMHGDVTVALRELMAIIGHIQIASVPSRHEPEREELNYPWLFDEIDRLGYQGFVGCEYNPRGATLDGLGWFKPYARTLP
ncbi:hydroxypyruvate isomerase family protein [Phyllobacterium sp. BT25]|uniref:Hydroxypyruvate isomerase family protein n=1 Tax=Phyllobacterium pellucidum TaxID=2740464 RepID=A0A849VYK3_9HYPH|nr:MULTISPECIES: 2-oxo-tetronate isomerase [Phyllobacterium]NTS32873.1 hydroxypyruvate isomerase family protein [Phyllobacterium pellucidum]SFJ22917.1 hydroxypyruvate isomerase [Phyllobacterium sp. CL33Tsu]